MGKPLTQGTVSQGNSLENVVPSSKPLHTSGRIYEVSKSTYLSKLKGREGNIFEKWLKVEGQGDWLRIKEPRNVKTYENKDEGYFRGFSKEDFGSLESLRVWEVLGVRRFVK